MLNRLKFEADGPALSPISPIRELGAYEAMWIEQGASFKKIADRFAADPDAMPSDFVEPSIAEECASEVLKRFAASGVKQFGLRDPPRRGLPRQAPGCPSPNRVTLLSG